MCVIFWDRYWVVHFPFVGMVKFKFLAHLPVDHLVCLVLYSFCANFLHSLIKWLIVSSLSPHSLHLLFCWVLSILALIWLVLMELFCAAIRRDSVSLLTFPIIIYCINSCNKRYSKINFSLEKQQIVHYMRYVFQTSKVTFFLDQTRSVT